MSKGETSRHRARGSDASECGLPSPRQRPRHKEKSLRSLNVEATPGKAQRFRRLSSLKAVFQSGNDAQTSTPHAQRRAEASNHPSHRNPSSQQAGWWARALPGQPEENSLFLWNKSKNTGITSVDRSTKATLSTYNTWIQLSRLQKIYHFQSLKLRLATKPLTVRVVRMQQGRDLMFVM